jgi:hypothetical protein
MDASIKLYGLCPRNVNASHKISVIGDENTGDKKVFG